MTALRIAELELVDFRASDRWIRNFKQRHDIGERLFHGDSGSADQVYAEIAEVGLPKFLHGMAYTIWMRLAYTIDRYRNGRMLLNYCKE